MQLHHLKSQTTRKKARIGRGGKRGKTSGKGMKGQKSRTGNSTRPEMRDIIKKLPKRRGFGKNRARTVNNERVRPMVVNVSLLETTFPTGGAINPRVLMNKGLVHGKGGALAVVKVLGTGEVSKKFTISGCQVSETAKTKIVAAGGAVL